MIGSFLRRLSPPRAPDRGLDEGLALGALLVRMARADGHYDSAEAAEVTRILMERYALHRAAAEDLRRRAEELEASAADTVRFTRAIKDTVPYDRRQEIVEALWTVALSDGARDADEDGLVRLAASLLGVNDRDSAMARHRVEARNP